MKVVFDTENTSEYGVYDIFKTEDEFLKQFSGTLPYPRNANTPERYPVMVFQVSEFETGSGRENIEFFFIYDFEIVEDDS